MATTLSSTSPGFDEFAEWSSDLMSEARSLAHNKNDDEEIAEYGVGLIEKSVAVKGELSKHLQNKMKGSAYKACSTYQAKLKMLLQIVGKRSGATAENIKQLDAKHCG